MIERKCISQILRTHGARPDLRLFRNNTGQAWTGDSVRMRAGDALIRNARPLHAGLCVGSPDLVGWRAVTITPEMVGAQIAQFTGIEVKTGRQRPTRAQRQFLDTLQRFGGFALVVREGDDLAAVLDGTGPLS